MMISSDIFKPYINISQKQNEVLFNANSVFSTKSVADLAEVIDRDGSFFFSQVEIKPAPKLVLI